MTLQGRFDKHLQKTQEKEFGKNLWGYYHVEACRGPNRKEQGILLFLRGLIEYADHHRLVYESPMGEDSVLGAEWLAILNAVRGLLNGDLGRLDGGTLDTLLCDLASDAGFPKVE